MPSAFLLESETIVAQKNDLFVDQSKLTDDEFLVYEALQKQASLKVQDIMKILNRKNVFPLIQKLMDKNILTIQEEINEVYKPKLIRYIRLHAQYDNNEGLALLLEKLKNAEKQKNIVLQYFQLSASEKKPISVKQLIEKADSTSTIIRTLIDKEIFEEYFIQVDRIDIDHKTSDNFLQLSSAQEIAFQQINKSFDTQNVCL